MSYPPYQQSEELHSVAASLAQDEAFSSLVAQKLEDKIKDVVQNHTAALRVRITMLESEKKKLWEEIENIKKQSSTKPPITENTMKQIKVNSDNQNSRKVRVDKQLQVSGAEGNEEGYGYNPPYGGAPYPPSSAPHPSTQPPYPTQMPQGGGVFAPSLGFKADAPMYMPTPGYPPQAPQTYPSYPSPTSSAPYPPNSGSSPYPHNPSSSPYPPSSAAPDPSNAGSAPYRSSKSSAPYPSSQGSASYPSNPSSAHYSSSTSAYPPSTPAYPNSGASYSTSGSTYGRTSHSNTSYPTSGSQKRAPPPPSRPSYPSGTSYSTNTQNSSGSGHGPYIKKTTPTVIPANPFNGRADAEILRKAMKGFGTDDKAIISVISKRSNAQRLQIAVEFKTLYGKDLIKDLKSETSGKYEDLIVALMTPLPQYYAKELHDAISGLGTDENVLIEVLCTKTNNEIRTIRAAYYSMYGRSLEDDLMGDTSGTFKRIMVSLCNACRDESTGTNAAAAAKDAQDLLRAGELKFGTDESTFNMVLCQRSYAQLRLIFDEYYRITGHDFENAIKNEFSGNSKDGLLAIVRSIRNQPCFFAKCLHKAIAGLGTDDGTLIRVVVTRCEIDMGEIKQNYLAQYGETLADAIKGDTSGDYKKLLFALIGES